MSNVNITPIVGLSHSTGWSQVVEFNDVDAQCVLTFSVQGENVQAFGRAVVQELLDQKPLDAQRVYDYISELQKRVKEENITLSLAAGIFKGEEAVIVCLSGAIILKRKQKVGVVLASDGDIQITEGHWFPTDTYVFLTDKAKGWINKLEDIIQHDDNVDSIVTSLVPEVHALSDSSLHALAFLSEKKETNGERIEKKKNSIYSIVHYVFLSIKKVLKFLVSVFLFLFQSCKKITQVVFSKDEYLGKDKQKQIVKRIVLAALVIAAGVGVWLFISNRNQEELVAAQAFVSPFQERRENIELVVQTDPIQAREMLQKLIKDLTTEQLNLEEGSVIETLATEELVIQQQLFENISGREEFAELQTYYDLRLVDSSFVSKVVHSSGDRAVFIDKEKKVAIILQLDQKKATEVSVSQLSSIEDVVVTEKSAVILSNDGIWEYTFDDAELTKIIGEGDSNREAEYVQFFDPYIYAFNVDKRNIYRYAPADSGFSDPIGWLVDKQGLLFSEVVSFAIDGDVWLSTKKGQIKKYSSGEPADFSITGLPDLFSSSIQLVTNSDIDSLFVLEAATNRVVVLQKTGEFLKEIKSQSLGTVTDIFVSEDGSQVFAVSGSLVFVIEV